MHLRSILTSENDSTSLRQQAIECSPWRGAGEPGVTSTGQY